MLNFLKKYKITIIFSFFLIISLRIYTFYFANVFFGDEYDNFTYSWLFKNGYVPYKDFFSHQFPFLLLVGTILEFISHSQFIYRLFVLLTTFTFFTYFYFYFKGVWRLSILLFMLFSSFSIALYGGQQFDEGSFLAIFLVSGFFITAFKKKRLLNTSEIVFFALLILLVLFSSPIFVMPLILLLFIHIVLTNNIINKTTASKLIKRYTTIPIIIAAGLIIFVSYLLITFSLKDFVFSTINFNNQVYWSRIGSGENLNLFEFYPSSAYHTSNHFLALIKLRGPDLITFAKASKFLIIQSQISLSVSEYFKIIFSQFYDNFFIFESFIAIFYFIGISTLLIKKKFTLVVFSILFVLFLRLRPESRLHMAPFYLFSYWLLSLSIAFPIYNLMKIKNIFTSLLTLLMITIVITLFITKNWYDFEQTSFNPLSRENRSTIQYLKNNSTEQDNILVVRDFSSSYYYDSQRFPSGKFINYFEWYGWSDKLRGEWHTELRAFDGKYIVVSKKAWDNYSIEEKVQVWLRPTFELIKKSYVITFYTNNDVILKKKIDE